MIINKYKYDFATFIYAIVVIFAFYSFGTFGFLNLFGLRNSFQFVIVLFTFFGLISIIYNIRNNIKYKKNFFVHTLIIAFFMYYGYMLVLIKGELLNTLLQSTLMLVFVLYLILVEIKYIKIIIKTIIIITFILSIMGFLAYFSFLINENLINEVNFLLYDSTKGSSVINANSWVEYLSFTSGDGFELFGTNVTRVKGFCNEPSATVVHYLAPAGLAFLFSRKYKLIGIFIIVFNFIGIASLISWIAIFGSVIIYMLLSIKNKFIKIFIIYVSLIFIFILMTNIDFAVSLILDIGNSLHENTSSSLIARKEGSATVRLMSLSIALNEFKNNIFGGSSYSTMTGLLIQVSLVGGIFMLTLLIVFSNKMIKFGINKFNYSSNKDIKFAVSLTLSIFIVSLLLSNYGWNRIPGVIMLILFYKSLRGPEDYQLNKVCKNIY